MKLKKIIKKMVPSPILHLYNNIKGKIFHIIDLYKWKEHRIFFHGLRNSDKIYYIIRIRDTRVGLFSIFCQVLSHIQYAINKNYVPYVDMKNYPNQYLPKSKLHKENSWNYYFEQPASDFKLKNENYRKYKNIILNSSLIPDGRLVDPLYLVQNPSELSRWRKLSSKLIKLSSLQSRIVENEFNILFSNGEKVLGVLCRGTDYLNRKPSGHPVQPEPEDVIKLAEKIMKEKKCKKLFLATEDESIYQLFEEKFHEKLITNKHTLFTNTGSDYLADIKQNRKDEEYLRGAEYLTTIVLLSRCNYLIAGRTNGTSGALIMSKGFEYIHIYDLGYYD